MLKLTHSMTGRKELFDRPFSTPLYMYVCGITPYDHAHIGHGRVFVTFDVLYRFLRFLGYDVRYCRNYTDIDDKLIKKAANELQDPLRYQEVAEKYIASFKNDMEALGCLPPTLEPKVTQNIEIIIDFIQKLIEQKKAYVVDGDVYFSLSQFPNYGKLSKQKIEDLRVGARVEINEQKKDPLDFALWKSEEEGTFFKSPWGYGRPGWHIECSALAAHYLSPELDIHGGGADLIFPHHENEIAQSESLFGKPLSRFWLHVAFVRINQEKMSKSLGNVKNLHELFTTYDPMVIRFYYVSHHYRTPLDFSDDDIIAAQKTYQKLCMALASAPTHDWTNEELRKVPIVKEMLSYLYDDLNTPGMFGVIFSNLQNIIKDPKSASSVKYFLQTVLGLSLEPLQEKEIAITPEIEHLINQREEARKNKDFKKADELREQLKELGYESKDTKIQKT